MDKKEIGFSILVAGAFFIFLGIILLFDKALIAAGNILIVLGTLILLNTKIVDLFRVKNAQGIVIFALGVIVLFYGYILLGFIMECAGLAVLFYDKMPTIKGLSRSIARKIFMI